MRRTLFFTFLCPLVCIALTFTSPLPAQVEFLRGDVNGDGLVNVVDVDYLIIIPLFPWQFPPPCEAAADIDDNGDINFLVDGVFLLNALYVEGAPPIPPPYPECGVDPDDSGFACNVSSCDEDPVYRVNSDLTLTVVGDSGVLGDEAVVRCYLDNATGEDVSSLTWSMCQVGEGAVISDVVPGNGYPADEPTFFVATLLGTDGYTLAVLPDISGQVLLPPGDDQQLAIAIYDLVAPGTVTLEFCNDLGDPFVETLVVNSSGQPAVPETMEGVITVSPGFLRGDVNGDSMVGIADPIMLLQFLFASGAPPPCIDATDVDDNGVANGLVDSIGLLNALFIAGSPQPPAPGTQECGPDPTPDLLGCATYDSCP